MNQANRGIYEKKIQGFFLITLFLSIPFSIAGDDFSIIGLYLCFFFSLFRGKRISEIPPMFYGLLVLLLGAVLSSLLSSNIPESLLYFRNLWRLGLPFLVFSALMDREHSLYINLSLIVSAAVCIFAVVQYFTGITAFESQEMSAYFLGSGARVWIAKGLFSHHLTFGGVCLILFSLFFPAVFDASLPTRRRVVFTFGSVLNLAGIVVCMGRSIWLGTIAALAVVLLLKLSRRQLGVLAVVFVIGLGALLVTNEETKRDLLKNTAIGKRIESISVSQNMDRILMWRAAFNAIRERPVFGYGPARAEEIQPFYDRLAEKEKHTFQHRASVGVHNIFLQNWLDFGLTGLIGYLFFFGLLIGQSLKYSLLKPALGKGTESYLIGIVAGLSGILLAGVFENNFRDGEVQTAVLTVMGLALSLIYKKKAMIDQGQRV